MACAGNDADFAVDAMLDELGPVGMVWAEGGDGDVGTAAALVAMRAAALSIAGELDR